MEPLIILLFSISLILSIFLIYQVIKFVRKLKQFSNDSTVKDIHVIKYDNKVSHGDKSLPAKTGPNKRMDLDLMEEIADNQYLDLNERRKNLRKDFQAFVEFIKEGRLFKETSRDLSYSGIFLKSKTPDQYNINDFIILTFQISKSRPQKYNGQVVRKDSNGIGIKFID